MWLTKLIRYDSWLTFGGCLILLVGLCLDELIHRLFPQTVLGEDLFSLTNPGHLLTLAGVAVLVVNSEVFLLERAWRLKHTARFKSAYLIMAAVWLVGLCVIGLLLTTGGTQVNHF